MPRLSQKQQVIKALKVIQDSELRDRVRARLADRCLTCDNSEYQQIKARAYLIDDFLNELVDMVNAEGLNYDRTE